MREKLVAILEWIAQFFQNLWLDARLYLVKSNPGPLPELKKPMPVVNVGDTAFNPEWGWIKVQNPKGRPNGNSFHKFGDHAGIKAGAKLTVIAHEGIEVLVSYESPEGQGYGSEAGNGTLFFVPKRSFAAMTKVHMHLQEEEEARKQRIRRLLADAAA